MTPFYDTFVFKSLTFFLVVISTYQVRGTDFYVSPSGNDAGNGTKGNPWKTLQYACTNVASGGNHTIHLSQGTYIEKRITVPPGVSVAGAGKGLTIIKAHASVHYNPSDPGFGVDKFLINLVSPNPRDGNQTIKNITIDGDGKKLHGGIYLENRSRVNLENIQVQFVNFCGVWMMGMRNSIIKQLDLKDCGWSSTGWCSGALQISNSESIDVSGFNIDESKGYGFKNLAHRRNTPFTGIKIHDGRISVSPKSLWNKGSAPNISIEIWGSSYPGTEIFNCYVDNHISLVNFPEVQRTTPIKIYNNVFDISGPRAKGDGYCIELSIHDAEVYNNWFNGGSIAIVNWGDRQFNNWNIHHNTFYGMSSIYPTAIITSYKGGLKDINIFNNTAEMSGTATVNFIEFNHGGISENINIKNNLIINSNTKYEHYPNRFISLERGATLKNLHVSNNLLFNLDIGTVNGSYSKNLSTNPMITKSGLRPKPYYLPRTGSPLINAGVRVGLPFKGDAPEIGAFEIK